MKFKFRYTYGAYGLIVNNKETNWAINLYEENFRVIFHEISETYTFIDPNYNRLLMGKYKTLQEAKYQCIHKYICFNENILPISAYL